MKKIKLKTIYANSKQNGSPGDIIEVSDDEYKDLIKGKYGVDPSSDESKSKASEKKTGK